MCAVCFLGRKTNVVSSWLLSVLALKDRHNPSKGMDYMDIDQVCDVPDTPDRLPVQNIDGRVCIQKESDSSVVSHSGNANLLDGGARNQLRGKSRLVTDGGHSRRLTFRHGKNLSSSNKSESDSDFTVQLGSSSKNAHLFRRMVADKTANHENKYSLHSQRTEKGKTPCTSQSSTHRENGLVDLTEQSEPAEVFQKAFPNRASEGQHAKEIREGLTSTNGFSSLHVMANPSMLGRKTYKGKEKMDDTCKGVSGVERGKGIFGDPQPKVAKNIPISFHSISSPRVSGQKRLVRNGCISPHNIAKAKQSSGDRGNGPMDFQNDKETPVTDCSSSLIRDLIAEDNNSHRGQGVISHLFSSKQPDSRTTSTRFSITQNEEASETSNASGDAFKCFEGLGGWRSTRNRTKKINLPLSDEVQHLSRTKDDQFVSQQTKNRVERSDNENGQINRIDNDYREDQNAVSFQHGSTSNVSQAVSCPIALLDQGSGSRIAASTLKRQKQGFATRNHGESSASVHSEVVFLGSSGEPSNSRSNRNQNGRGPRILDPVIEIDEFSPEIRNAAPGNMGRSSNDDSDARAMQVQADEMLARELQEQLYNESPGVGDGEIDAHIALALQQEGTSHHAFSSGTHPVFHPRGSILSNFHRQSQSRSSQNSSVRRGTQARGPVVSSRFTRLRSRLPSQSPRIRYRERNSVFPANMDLDMRIHILEALEAFSDMGMSSNFLQVDREFTEDDYEMLLALDENNHQHGGASLDQINGLPQSTVQGDNFEEACAICLETPSSGDTIRHLPCLHKFHKDCIDPWLRRKTSCPVCKSSVT